MGTAGDRGATRTSRCSLQILHSQMAWGRLLVLCTPHLVHTFCGQKTKSRVTPGPPEMSPTPAGSGQLRRHHHQRLRGCREPKIRGAPGVGGGLRGSGRGLTFLQSSQTTQAEPLVPSCSPQRMQRFTPSPSTLRRMSSSRVIRRLARGHRNVRKRRWECQGKSRIRGKGAAPRGRPLPLVRMFLSRVSLPTEPLPLQLWDKTTSQRGIRLQQVCKAQYPLPGMLPER